MSEQILAQPVINTSENNVEKAKISLEKARLAHERYLIRQNNRDLNEAIEHYIDAVKYDPTLPESYYRLASLMFEQGQIGIETAIEQCKTAVSLAPKNMNAHMYTGFFMKLAQDFKSAEAEFKSAIKMGKLNSARPRLILSQAILQKINSKNGNAVDYITISFQEVLCLPGTDRLSKCFTKTCRMIFLYSLTIRSENFWKDLNSIMPQKIFIKKLHQIQITVIFFTTRWVIWL